MLLARYLPIMRASLQTPRSVSRPGRGGCGAVKRCPPSCSCGACLGLPAPSPCARPAPVRRRRTLRAVVAPSRLRPPRWGGSALAVWPARGSLSSSPPAVGILSGVWAFVWPAAPRGGVRARRAYDTASSARAPAPRRRWPLVWCSGLRRGARRTTATRQQLLLLPGCRATDNRQLRQFSWEMVSLLASAAAAILYPCSGSAALCPARWGCHALGASALPGEQGYRQKADFSSRPCPYLDNIGNFCRSAAEVANLLKKCVKSPKAVKSPFCARPKMPKKRDNPLTVRRKRRIIKVD